MRLEDIDPRCRKPENAQLIIDDLKWLGIDWDEEPLVQSSRNREYRKALDQLSSSAHVYPCFCSRADLHAASAPHASDGTPIYGGTCRKLTEDEIAERSKSKTPALRIEVPRETIAFDDLHMGSQVQELCSECGDFVVLRSDGAFAYQLVVVVDDAASNVTEVVRGSDLIASTFRQIWLYRVLGLKPPAHAHHPVLLAPDGKRLSKREKSLDMGVLRKRYAPEELLGKIAYLSGLAEEQAPTSLSALLNAFSWDAIVKHDVYVTEDVLALE